MTTVPQYAPPRPGHPWCGYRLPVERLADIPDPGPGPQTAGSVAAALRAAIAAGWFRQGEKLPPYTAIARRYDTSPDTVRCGVVMLEGTGEVQVRRHHGAYVRAAGRQAT